MALYSSVAESDELDVVELVVDALAELVVSEELLTMASCTVSKVEVNSSSLMLPSPSVSAMLMISSVLRLDVGPFSSMELNSSLLMEPSPSESIVLKASSAVASESDEEDGGGGGGGGMDPVRDCIIDSPSCISVLVMLPSPSLSRLLKTSSALVLLPVSESHELISLSVTLPSLSLSILLNRFVMYEELLIPLIVLIIPLLLPNNNY
jgi:hypothetical protein